ncbi:hypothetical protein BX666DRAFT_480758 [Dichotomocladium elegans]|nr:hypothetical protein BX666DRAFT_480758 [Dichotomocladium elegans]
MRFGRLPNQMVQKLKGFGFNKKNLITMMHRQAALRSTVFQTRHSLLSSRTSFTMRFAHTSPALRLRPLATPALAKSTRSLRDAIRKRNQNAVWDAYTALVQDNKSLLIPSEYHSMVLQSFRLKTMVAYGPEQISSTKDRIQFVLEQMAAAHISPDVRDYNHLLDFYSRVGDWDACTKVWRALEAAQDYTSLTGLAPSTYTYNLYMRAAILTDNTDKVFDILQMMKNAGVTPNGFTIDTLIEAHGKLGDIKGVNRVFAEAFKAQPHAHSATSQPQRKKSTFSFWTFNTTSPDALAGHVKAVLQQSGVKQLRPTAHTFVSMIDAHGRKGHLRSIDHVYNTLLAEYKIKPTLDIYNSLIRWYCQHSQVDSARRIFFDMERAGIKPNVITFNYLFRHEALRHQNPWRAEGLMELMRKIYNLEPVQSMYRALIKVYNKKNREEDADRLFQAYMASKEVSQR